MERIIFIFFISCISCKQNTENHDIKDSATTKQEKVVFTITDKSYIDSLLNDTASILSFNVVEDSQKGEFVSEIYKLELPAIPTNYTNDYELLFTKEEIEDLNKLISEFEAETSIEIAIVTIDQRWIAGVKFDSLITVFGNYWGVGKKDENNGIIIGISRGLKKIRIINGSGIESKISDDETKSIIEETILPYFREARYYEGVRSGLVDIMSRLR